MGKSQKRVAHSVGMTGLPERDQLPFGCMVVLLFHEPKSFHGLPIDVRSHQQEHLTRTLELGSEVPCRQSTVSSCHLS
jgi:hypothetical protein